jgi:hypothetical protein
VRATTRTRRRARTDDERDAAAAADDGRLTTRFDGRSVVETIPVYFNRAPDDGGEMVLIQVRKPRGKRARDAREASERAIDGD